MGLLDKLKQLLGDGPQGDGIDIHAPVSGELVDIESVPDVVFAEKIVGDGIAIKPSSHQVVAPVNGTIGKIFETNHAFSIESEQGVEIFVHLGIDTVELKGEGFLRVASEGQQVKKGDVVLECDLKFLEAHARSTLTPIVVSNMDDFRHIRKKTGKVKAGEDVILTLYR
ncbi:PTS glucose transporter subunit IIA [Gallaecimonas xiamenensis]|uniref:PTS system glucose-specific EIIA component n=1 Tax=Gallaecimonas xiamenensis 3-C-1 TaxID=745411 RepID=K2KFV3_9GAMM|nr:PTS glucose transporter subunit IIA [Gallaecimonas xiamenensis]EKE76205.1 PTS system glucose-specific transporter subunit IIA [Gallaecimonas xiamenensis 3-C-1]